MKGTAVSHLLSSKHHQSDEQLIANSLRHKGKVKSVQALPYKLDGSKVVVQENGPDNTTYRWCVRLAMIEGDPLWVSGVNDKKQADTLAARISSALEIH